MKFLLFPILLITFPQKAVIKNRNSTGDMLPLCLTPIVWGMIASSFPMFRTTVRFVYSLLITKANLFGTPDLFSKLIT